MNGNPSKVNIKQLCGSRGSSEVSVGTIVEGEVVRQVFQVRILVTRNHKSLQHIFDHKELNMRQIRWIELFNDYDCEIRYHLSKANIVADVLILADVAKGTGNMTRQDYHSSIQCALFEALYERKCKSHVLWSEVKENRLTGPERVQETINKVVLIKESLKAAADRQKSYAHNRRVPIEFKVGDYVLLRVNLMRLWIVGIKWLKRSGILIVKVRWNSARGPESFMKTKVNLESVQIRIFQAQTVKEDLDHSSKVLSMQEDDTEVQEAVEIVTTAKLMIEVVTAAATQVVAASIPIPAAKPRILNITAAPVVST
nr:reverse transcriptase domain-containing protein [Tanacetum cinerariifolium]